MRNGPLGTGPPPLSEPTRFIPPGPSLSSSATGRNKKRRMLKSMPKTNRTIEARINEHKRCLRLNHPEKSAVAEHSLSHDHTILFKETKKSCHSNSFWDKLTNEAIKIELEKNNFNRDVGYIISQSWKPVFQLMENKRTRSESTNHKTAHQDSTDAQESHESSLEDLIIGKDISRRCNADHLQINKLYPIPPPLVPMGHAILLITRIQVLLFGRAWACPQNTNGETSGTPESISTDLSDLMLGKLLRIVRQIQRDQAELKAALQSSLAELKESLERNKTSISALTTHVEELRTHNVFLSKRAILRQLLCFGLCSDGGTACVGKWWNPQAVPQRPVLLHFDGLHSLCGRRAPQGSSICCYRPDAGLGNSAIGEKGMQHSVYPPILSFTYVVWCFHVSPASSHKPKLTISSTALWRYWMARSLLMEEANMAKSSV
ncbi:hypothetical protein J437_LFUL006953 [Ladona fulva]|uniref:Uncharacterized protein n=1 Tax=Ladona fulva TaxID=123851 RepID=A0A8K0KBF4_LADFU|nr:hypothetical protein J437_LFUL006953 [Ladona fulva]